MLSSAFNRNYLAGLAIASLLVGICMMLLGTQSVNAGVGLITTSAVFFGLWQFSKQNERAQSLTLVETAAECFQRCTQILEQEPPTRVNWILAARTAQAGLSAASRITETDHLTKFDAISMPYRIRIWRALKERPVEFFWCVENNEDLPENPRERTEQLARTAYKKENSFDYESAGRAHTIEHMAPVSLYALLAAARVPEGFDDPLDEFRGHKHELPLSHEFSSLRTFLQFHKQNYIHPKGFSKREP